MSTQENTEDSEKDSKTNENIETVTTEDENSDSQEDTSNEDSEENEDSSEDDDESETEDEEQFAKRFTQFKGDTYKEYVPNLEKAHAELISEISRIKQADKGKQAKLDAVMQAAARDPEFATKLNELIGDDAKEVTVDPALLQARQDMEEKMAKEYKDFTDLHPEFETDPQLQEEVFALIDEWGATARKQGKILSMSDALNRAYSYLGKDNTKEDIASRAKETAAKSKTGNSKKKSSENKGQFTEDQIKLAKKWGLTPEQLASNNT